METTTFTGPNYAYNYSAIQMVLPLDLSFIIDKSDPVVSFVEAIKEVNLSEYVKPITSNNTNSHDRTMLLKVILFAYSENKRSLSEITNLCKTDIRYIWLSNEEKPSHMAFQRLMNQLTTSIDEVFFNINKALIGEVNINKDIQFIDGTKIEANAHKNSFVYKKRIINARESLYHKISMIIHNINIAYGYHYPIKNTYCAQELGYIAQYLMETMVFLETNIVYGKGHRKDLIQKHYDEILDYYLKLDEYEYWLDIIDNRNSCSKIDHDATFMATKWDYYNQSGLTRPCYNPQIAVSDGFIVNADVYQNPTDTLTYIPFMQRYYEHYGCYPKWPVADAGYGSYDNYMFNIRNSIELVQKYNMYNKEKDQKFKKKKFHTYNWEINEEGYKVCPEGRIFSVFEKDIYKHSGNELQIKQVYTEPKKCEGCPFISECTKNGKYKSIYVDVVQRELYQKVNSNLSTEFGKWLKRQRCAQVEGAFGSIKQNSKFTRFTRRGLKNVKMEFLLVCLGYNLRKYHQFRMEKYIKPSKKLETN